MKRLFFTVLAEFHLITNSQKPDLRFVRATRAVINLLVSDDGRPAGSLDPELTRGLFSPTLSANRHTLLDAAFHSLNSHIGEVNSLQKDQPPSFSGFGGKNQPPCFLIFALCLCIGCFANICCHVHCNLAPYLISYHIRALRLNHPSFLFHHHSYSTKILKCLISVNLLTHFNHASKKRVIRTRGHGPSSDSHYGIWYEHDPLPQRGQRTKLSLPLLTPLYRKLPLSRPVRPIAWRPKQVR